MSLRPDKQIRKDELHKWRAAQRAAARAKFPLPDEQMQAMFDMLDSALPKHGCDHSLRLVREWAMHQRIEFDKLETWCLENGGCCDCEVLATCEQHWRDAKHD